MTKETLKEKILNVVKSSEGIDKKSISEFTSAKGIVLEGALSKLLKEKILAVEEREGQKLYFVSHENSEASTSEEEVADEKEETISATEKKKNKKGKKENAEEVSGEDAGDTENSQEVKGQSKGNRDMRKFKFDGVLHTKGGLVLAVVRKYVDKHKNISLTKLKEVFPDELLQRFGVVQEIKKAKTFTSGGRDRFFMKDDQIIKVNGSRVVCSNQWTSDNIKPFLTAARKLGYDIR